MCESAVYRHSSFFLLLRPSFNLLKSKIDCDSYFILGLSILRHSTAQNRQSLLITKFVLLSRYTDGLQVQPYFFKCSMSLDEGFVF